MNFSSWPSSISIMIIKGCNGNEAFGVNYYAGISDIIYGLWLNCCLQLSLGVSLTSSIGVNGLNQRVSYYSYILRTRVKNNVILINKTDHNKKLIGSKRVFEIHDLKTIQFGDLTKLDHFAKPIKNFLMASCQVSCIFRMTQLSRIAKIIWSPNKPPSKQLTSDHWLRVQQDPNQNAIRIDIDTSSQQRN